MSTDHRYAQWCKERWAQEVQSDFTTLRSLQGSAAWRFVEALEAIPDRVAMVAVGDALIDRRVFGTTSQQADMFVVSVPTVSRLEMRLEDEKRNGRWSPVNRKQLWRAIQQHPLFSVLGEPWKGAPITERGGLYISKIGNMDLRTMIDLGGSSRQMAYEQTVLVSGTKIIELSHTSYLGWYGFTPATHWHFIGMGQETRAADLLLTLVEVGIRELPRLIAGT